MKVEPVVLEGERVRLEPLEPRHAPGLWEAARDPVIWRWFPFRIASLAETIEPVHERLEIGATWLNPRHQRTGANTEAKLLLLRHAFERLGCRRVEFKTDSENRQSRTALVRIGVRQEGIFRSHMIRPDGGRRDGVYFSVIDEEWPRVRKHLEALLARG
jgi:RimJ/RimL family protein N-acetyltransferase